MRDLAKDSCGLNAPKPHTWLHPRVVRCRCPAQFVVVTDCWEWISTSASIVSILAGQSELFLDPGALCNGFRSNTSAAVNGEFLCYAHLNLPQQTRESWMLVDNGNQHNLSKRFFLRPALYNKNGATRLSRIIRIKSQEEMPFTCLIHVVPCSFFVIQQDWRSICCSSVELTVLPPPLHKTRQSSCCTRLVPGQGCENSTPPKDYDLPAA